MSYRVLCDENVEPRTVDEPEADARCTLLGQHVEVPWELLRTANASWR